MEPKDVIAPTAKRCTTYMDIVIVLDGSNSIYPWNEVQNFLSNILSKFHISPEQMQVGVIQYGEISVHEWSLRDYQTIQDVVEAAKNISRQEGRETHTAEAIRMACTEAFSPERGAREGATKVMIVVTDGESHDGEDLPDVLSECEKRNITRYAIAVLGYYIRVLKNPTAFIKEIKSIASDPDEKYFFNVTDEAALNDIVDALGERIFSLEGTLGYNESTFLEEMSQIGFSTHILDDGILFGMVGAYDWDGGVLKETSEGRLMPSREAFEKEFPLELKNHAAYLGYTVSSVVVGDWRRLYVAGAPRFKHKGKVILFDLTPDGDVIITQALNGEQIGSYFGSEVCVVDVDQDGITDILLIAAPMFLGAGNKETGKVYVYCLDGDGFAPNGTLHSQRKVQDARFGYAMAVAPDLNHDGYTDLLVGAPLEDDHQGALYIYHGDEYYIIPQYKQRIAGSSVSARLQYFGRSLSALLDLDGDELLDLAVGAQGSAVLLRSRSIVQINASLSFQPHSINVIQKNCHRAGRDSACLNATVCFLAMSRSPGSHGTYFDMQMEALLDDRKILARALFDNSSQRQSLLGVSVRVGEKMCSMLPFHVFDTADYIRPISFTLRFKINDTDNSPVLDEGWPTTVKMSIPFFKDCGEDDVCVTDLSLQAHMDISGTSRQKPYVIRGPRRRLAVEVQLQNRLENAYNTSLTLHYSKNLHFSSLSIREDVQFKMECTALRSNSHSCNVSYPVFRSHSKVNFMLEFEFSCTSLNSKVQIKLVAESDSVESVDTLLDNSVQLQSVVQYEPELFITSDSNLNRYEVHPTRTMSEGTGPEFYTHFRVQNSGCYAIRNLELSVNLPSVASGDRVFATVVDAFSQNASGVNCRIVSDVAQLKSRQRDVRPLHPEDMKKTELLNCSSSWCVEVMCNVQQLLKGEMAKIRITRRIHDNFFRQAKFKAVTIVGSYQLSARESNLITIGDAALLRETVLEVLKGRSIPISLWILIGSIIGGLLLLALLVFILWKLGFFSRKQRKEEDENSDS
ncbi:integrin alpha-10 isoform X3 [Triplophysa rosa]|nr:integrin alpha-10 isoform X3 [Triplophysa rosa]